MGDRADLAMCPKAWTSSRGPREPPIGSERRRNMTDHSGSHWGT